MALKLQLSIYPRARNVAVAKKALVRFQRLVPKKIIVKTIERNYQDKSTFRIDGTVRLRSSLPQDALYESLRLFQKISFCWLVCGPYKRHDRHWQFDVFAEEHQMKAAGVEGFKSIAYGISPGTIPEEITIRIKE